MNSKTKAMRVPEINYNHELITIILFAIVMICLSLASAEFLTVINLTTVVRNFMEVGLISLGMTLIIISGNIDLSVGSIMSLSGIAIAMVNRSTGNFFLAIVVGLAVGCLCGWFNGFLVGYLDIPSFIVTLATQFIFKGLSTGISQAESIGGLPANFTKWGMGRLLGLPNQLWLFAVCCVIFIVILQFTAYGRYLRVIGFNKKSGHFSGINVPRAVTSCFTIQGAMCALAAIVMVARSASARATFGTTSETAAITAVVLGGTSIIGGYGSIAGTIIAVFLVGIIKNGLTMAGVSAEVSTIVQGALLLFSIVFSENAKRWIRTLTTHARKGEVKEE